MTETTIKTGFSDSSAPLSILVLGILYLVGIAGVAFSIHPDFLLLTPANLLISLFVVLYHHPQWTTASLLFLPVAYFWGFGAELFGVQTGLLFGEYQYERVLGWKLWGTPLMIGINWVLLAYSAGCCANHILGNRHWAWRALLAAGMMVLLDVFIEPVAIRYDFWSWMDEVPPLRNYLGWFGVALPLQMWFAKSQGQVRNKVAVALFIFQFVFFITLGII